MEKNNSGSFSLKFKWAMLLLSTMPMIVSIIIISLVLTGNLESKIKDGIVGELKVATSQLEQYFAYDIIANGEVDYEEYSDHEYVESLKSEDIELTLFIGDTRLLNSLKKADGGYNEGSKASESIYAAVSRGEDYYGENVTINDKQYFVYYRPIYDGEGNFWGMAFAGKEMSSVNAAVVAASNKIVMIAVLLIVVIGALMFFIGNKLTKNLLKVIDNIEVLAEGKLKADFEVGSIINEINMLSASGATLQDELKTTVGGAIETANNLGEAVANVDKLSVETADGTNRIAEAISELAKTAQLLADTVLTANDKMNDMGQSIDTITSNIDGMNKSSDASTEANKIAIEYMNKLESASGHTATAVEDIGHKIAECSEAAEKIKRATVAITEISEQTNLLSLNASIEAARAGEAGKGFAVVAGEIQKLAEQSAGSAVEIQDIIREILTKVSECVEKAKEMTGIIAEQTEFLGETKAKIDDMSVAGKELAEGASAIGEEAGMLLGLKEDVLSAITGLSAISQENAASAQEVTATVDGIARAVDSTKDESNQMRELANELNRKMEFFEI